MTSDEKRLLTLINRMCSDDLNERESLEIQSRLEQDPEALDMFIRFTDLHATLMTSPDHAAPTRVESIPLIAASSAWQAWSTYAALGFALWLATLPLAWLIFPVRSPTAIRATASRAVATLIAADKCRWDEPISIEEGEVILASRLTLLEGLAVLRFEVGADVIMHPGSSIELVSRGCVKLHRGRLTIQCPEEAHGFRVETPQGILTDLGTEFAIKVEASQPTAEVHVLQGQVAYDKLGVPTQPSSLLREGRAYRIDNQRLEVSVNESTPPERFVDLIQTVARSTKRDSILAMESFDYPIGPIDLSQADGGRGWTAAWDVWSVRTDGFQSDAKLDMVALAATGDGPCWFDELMIGTNWRSVLRLDSGDKSIATR